MTESHQSQWKDEPRIAALLAWLDMPDLPIRCDLTSLRPASSDASFRRYFRLDALDGDQSLIVMDAPPPQEDCRPFVEAAQVLQNAGLNVPIVVASDVDAGFLLLSDLGNQTLLDRLQTDPGSADNWYRQAGQDLIRLQQASQPGVFAPYDKPTLLRELSLFDEWYVSGHKGYSLSAQETETIANAYDTITAVNLAEPSVFVHRDFHSRNLMVTAGQQSLGVLDFQDALYGPISYDLVSLLRDAYIEWPEEKVIDWTIRYWEAAREAGLPVRADFGQFWTDFEFMGLQRHLKVLGIFCRLNYRDGKPNYLDDLPVVLRYVKKTVSRYESLNGLTRLLARIEGVELQTGYSF